MFVLIHNESVVFRSTPFYIDIHLKYIIHFPVILWLLSFHYFLSELFHISRGTFRLINHFNLSLFFELAFSGSLWMLVVAVVCFLLRCILAFTINSCDVLL